MPITLSNADACVDAILQRVGSRLVVGAPLGLGKPNPLINALYRRASTDRTIELRLLTALSLERPRARNALEQRFLAPFVARHFGADYPDLDYLADLRAGRVPDNVEIAEFYLAPGQFLATPSVQQNYTSINYTHVQREMLDRGVNVIAQLISRGRWDGRDGYSLGSNPDVTLDLVPQLRERGQPLAVVGEIHPRMPFMTRDAFVGEDFFDFILDSTHLDYELYAPPAASVSAADHLIGLYASTLIRDGGTLQIGIGSLSDAIVHWTLLRHEHNAAYRGICAALQIDSRCSSLLERWGDLAPFERGLYGASEMLMDGFVHLLDRGVLKRHVYDWPALQRLARRGALRERPDAALLDALFESGAIGAALDAHTVAQLREHGIFRSDVEWRAGRLHTADGWTAAAQLGTAAERGEIAAHCLGERLRLATSMHGGFFLGTKRFYRRLAELDDATRDSICMTGVGRINQLYGSEELDRLQRDDARFFNTAMKMSLLGAATSDALEDGRVVSGVGGQYNFVAMAHALDDARSILMLRASREGSDGLESNIVWHYGHTTIPRHLRDVVITEYGIADLRGRSDAQCIAAMLEISDARFQDGLLRRARDAGKIPSGYRLPDRARQNVPALVEQALRRCAAPTPAFPFGSDFTAEEQVLIGVLQSLARHSRGWAGRARLGWRALRPPRAPPGAEPYLQRLGLQQPNGLRERCYRAWVIGGLLDAGAIEPRGETA